MANIYFCKERDDIFGLYVIADNRPKARLAYADEIGAAYIDIRASIRKKEVDEKPQVIDDCCSPLIDKYELPVSCDFCDYIGECEWRDKRTWIK